ncbi:hypothetical protein DSM112329_04897 [Paraconexibacter sp. AEG42_29]|uniref:Uncharacterized protein n=1 Tax=Paraconexibacter sp. AEG42_29 TaxID=2997339 RepID=A0AAU7B319_9ACTN
MHCFPGRTALQLAAVSAVAVVSLGSAATANAALGGGKAPALTDRPNLVSVTPSATAVTFTYDRTIGCPGGCDGTEFFVGGYAGEGSAETPGANATVSGSSVRVTFTGGNPDTDVATYGRVADDAVNTQGSLGATNLGDSVRLTGAEGESGTRGHTVGPDLVSAVATGGGSNFITLTFDQDIDPATFDPVQVFITKANGDTVAGTAGTASVDDNVAEVEFPNTSPVAGAKQVFVTQDTATEPDYGFFSPVRSVQVGTQNQDSQAPLLKSAEITSADTVLYTFDKAVTTPNPIGFRIYSADVRNEPASSASVVGDGKQVQAQFSADQFTEYLVSTTTAPGAVQAQADTTPSAPGGVPIGGNAGAKATGFTTGPDAVQATYSGANVVVTLDSRILTGAALSPAGFQLLADDGTVIGGVPTATPQAQGIPGPSRVNLLYNTTAVANARALRLLPGTVTGTTAIQNIDQQLGR